MLKIAISGLAGSGKSTVSHLMTDALGLTRDEYHIAAFADGIKYAIRNMFPGCAAENLYGASKLRQEPIRSDLDEFGGEAINVSYRQVAIDIGKLGRSYHQDFWVFHMALEMKLMSKQPIKAFIVQDYRFPNEGEWLKKEGFKLIRLKRASDIKIDDISEHIQHDIPDTFFDFVIENNLSKDALKAQVASIVSKLQE